MKHIETGMRGLLVGFTSLIATAAFAQSQAPKLSVDWRYQNAETQALYNGVGALDLAMIEGDAPTSATDEGVFKSIFVVKLARTLQESLQSYEKACDKLPPEPATDEAMRCGPEGDVSIPERRCPPPLPELSCQRAQRAVAASLFAKVNELGGELAALSTRDAKLAEALDMTSRLAANMEKNAGQRPHHYRDGIPKGGPAGGPARSMPTPQTKGGQLRLTAGGAKDMAFLRKLIADGEVPSGDSVVIEGFMSEFDLPLVSKPCAELVCLNPAVAVDRKARKMYVQLGMESSVTAANFHRKPLNLSIVIDISGSMSANDNTEKNRLEWAKDATLRTLDRLTPADTISVVIFDGDSETLVAPTTVADRDAIVAKVKALQPRGSTNVESGLRRGFELVSSKFRGGYENRVILISDAGLNTGVTDQGILGRMVAQYAGERIGLTTIGLGENFNEEVVHHVTQSQGGNYIFVQSGAKMVEFFENFDFLVTPVAYNFKARLAIEGLSAKLKAAYGVPADAGEPVRELLDVRTLFFTSSGGGAILLEYDL